LNTKKIEEGIELVLDGLHTELNWRADPEYKDTPKRVARFYEEFFTRDGKPLTAFPEKFDQMVVLAHHTDWALCPHHLLPVKLDISLAYIPRGRVLGLSKLARLIGMNLHHPVSQEELTDRLAQDLSNCVRPTPHGSAVLIYGEHACMQMRGVKTTGYSITSDVRGVFRSRPEVKEEFLALVRR